MTAPAVLPGRGGKGPGGSVLRHVGKFTLVARASGAREAHDALQVPEDLAAGRARFPQVALQMIVAHVVGPAFQERRGHGYIESRAHRRKVAMVELILERLGARRQDDLAGREQRGDEISKGLSGAGARFADQHGVVSDRSGHPIRHFQLLRSHAVFRDSRCERPAPVEDGIELFPHLAAGANRSLQPRPESFPGGLPLKPRDVTPPSTITLMLLIRAEAGSAWKQAQSAFTAGALWSKVL